MKANSSGAEHLPGCNLLFLLIYKEIVTDKLTDDKMVVSWLSSLFTDTPPEYVFIDANTLIHTFTNLYLGNIAIQNILLLMILSSSLLGTALIVRIWKCFQMKYSNSIPKSISEETLLDEIEDNISSSSDEETESRVYRMNNVRRNVMARSNKEKS